MNSANANPNDPRAFPDRRQRETPMLSRYTFFGGKRMSRTADTYTDLYSTRAFVMLMLLTALNIMDAFFTLVYLQRGGTEGNPVADFLIRQGPSFFIFSKTFIIGGAICILCLHKNFGRARAGIALGVLLYVLLTAYHLFLFFRADVGQIL
ncbi:MAG: DUF5658 family protein [Planctomycetota bacterium]